MRFDGQCCEDERSGEALDPSPTKNLGRFLDAAGNLPTLTYPDGQGTLTYAYDAAGNRLPFACGSSTTTYAYDLHELCASGTSSVTCSSQPSGSVDVRLRRERYPRLSHVVLVVDVHVRR